MSNPSRIRDRRRTWRSSSAAPTRPQMICQGTHDPMRPITNYVRVIDLAAPASRHTGATNNIGAGGSTTLDARHVLPAGHAAAGGRLAAVGQLARVLPHAVGLPERRGREQRDREPPQGRRQELHGPDLEPDGQGAVRQELRDQRLRERQEPHRSRRDVARRQHHGRHARSSPPTPAGRTSAASMAPAKIVQTRGGWPFFEVDVTAAKANPSDLATLVPAPAPAAGRGGAGGGAGGAGRRRSRRPALIVTTEKLGDGLYRLTTGAGSYDSVIVEFKDYVMMLEAGQSEARGARLHRGNEEAVPEQADPLRDEHASALRSHRRAAGAGGRRRDDHHAEEQRGVPRAGAQHAAHAAERHAREEPEEGEDRDRVARRRSTRTAREPSRCTTSLRRRTRTA